MHINIKARVECLERCRKQLLSRYDAFHGWCCAEMGSMDWTDASVLWINGLTWFDINRICSEVFQ